MMRTPPTPHTIYVFENLREKSRVMIPKEITAPVRYGYGTPGYRHVYNLRVHPRSTPIRTKANGCRFHGDDERCDCDDTRLHPTCFAMRKEVDPAYEHPTMRYPEENPVKRHQLEAYDAVSVRLESGPWYWIKRWWNGTL